MSTAPRSGHARRRAGAGFTLVELLVAMGLTAVLAVGLYSLSMVASETFQQQQRISEIQLRLRSALELLRADLQRAGYMATPSSAADPQVCPRPTIPVQAVMLLREASNPTWLAGDDNKFINPVRLYLTGNFASTDQYRVMNISGNTIYLQNRTPEYGRIDSDAAFHRVFDDRLIRFQSVNGNVQFLRVTDATYSPAASASLPSITVAVAPVQIGAAAGAGGTAACGVPGLGVGATVAPLSTIEYRIANVSASQPNAYAGSLPFTTGKTDLVRTEVTLDASGAPTRVAATERIAVEYAVDFDVAGVFDEAAAGTLVEPVHRRYAFGENQNFDLLNVAGAGGAAPQRLRALALRLSVRDRTQDRDFAWVERASAAEPLTRFRVFQNTRGAARVRTVTTEITLPNLGSRGLR